MDFGGHYLLGAPRLMVWQALNDTSILAAVIPGCDKIEWISENRLELAVQVNLGVAHPTFTGELELSNVEPAVSYTLSGHAHGRLLGKAHGSADISLFDHGEDTRLAFVAKGGASAQILALGKPLIGHSVQRVIDGFFKRFGKAMQVDLTVLDHET